MDLEQSVEAVKPLVVERLQKQQVFSASTRRIAKSAYPSHELVDFFSLLTHSFSHGLVLENNFSQYFSSTSSLEQRNSIIVNELSSVVLGLISSKSTVKLNGQIRDLPLHSKEIISVLIDNFAEEYHTLLRKNIISTEQDALNFVAEYFKEVQNGVLGFVGEYTRSPLLDTKKENTSQRENSLEKTAIALGKDDKKLVISVRSPTKKLDDIIGLEDITQRLRRQLLLPLKNTAYYDRLIIDKNLHEPSVLYVFLGPPGTGKTHVAECIAGELGIPYFATTGASFEQMWHGLGAQHLRELYDQASSFKYSLVFIDEADTLLSSRTSDQSKYNTGVINDFLALTDGVSKKSNVITILASNMPITTIDKATINRSSVFNTLYFPDMTDDMRHAIARYKLQNYKHQSFSDTEFNSLCSLISASNSRSMRQIIHQAYLYAGEEQSDSISLHHLRIAFNEYERLVGEKYE